jgi:tellurite resistance protein
MQHSLFSWEVTSSDLILADDISLGSRYVDKTIKQWIESLDKKQREKFIDAIYTILCASEAKTVQDLEGNWKKSMGKILRSLSTIDDSTRKLIRKTFLELIRSAGRNMDTLWSKKKIEHK